MENEDIYDSFHSVSIFVVNGSQIVLVPVLGCDCYSDAASLFDFPIDQNFLGSVTLSYFEQMENRDLGRQAEFKDYWLMPKGIRSWKQFERSAYGVTILCLDKKYELIRKYPAKGGGFSPKGGESNLPLGSAVSADELGNTILSQLAYVQENLSGQV